MDASLDEKVVQLTGALTRARIPHAFGGAIALAYYAAPRGTEDIDVNVFVPFERAAALVNALAPLGVVEGAEPRDPTSHQMLLSWAHTPIHVFFSYDPFHESCQLRVRRVPFADGEIPILAAEDIVVFKVVYDRPKDRSEVREVLLCMGERLDDRYTAQWLERLLGADDARVALFRGAVDELRGPRGG